ncbi:MAG: hypothetical protein A3H28_05710 [Acidobacteria bacterium RIFCSPLOWO2_02_FULL_61_28]|nr:MAG: hypothetical protein A3H28_05710 [Acidobacteria bacterium RIFCSPLOWO2_02_FULL_61_28]
MPIKLTSANYKIIAIAVVVAAVSLGIAVRYFGRAFPEASLNLRVGRGDSEAIALRFLSDRGLSVDRYRHAAIFTYDTTAKLYLERTQGLDRMNQLTSGPIRLWRWSHRWFQPQQREEFRVEITPNGEVVGFNHQIPESKAGANLDGDSARRIAEAFVSRVLQIELGDLEFVDSSSNRRPARTDHVFTWKRRSPDLGDGSVRIAVAVAGEEVAGYAEFVHIPEQWSRDYEQLRSRNQSAQFVSQVFFGGLALAMLVTLILRLRDHDVPVRAALRVGIVGAILHLLGQANNFSVAVFAYPTTDPYTSFLAGYLARAILGAGGVGASVFLLVAAAEPVYREGFPAMVSLRRYLHWEGIRTRSFFMASVVGVALTFFFFAYQTLFYLLASGLGAWAPAEVPFTNQLNTAIPWAGALLMGFLPAVSEEMQFRAFAIPFLARWLRSWPLAILLSSFNWGFLHSSYPNQPFYIRGVEVGIAGILIALVMMRFGIMAPLIWHYSVDALYTAFLLVRSPDPYLMISGTAAAGIMLVPFLIALAAYWRSGTFVDESPLTNLSEGVHRPPRTEEQQEAPAGPAYVPLSARRLTLAAAVTIVGIAVALVPAYRFGDGVRIGMTSRDAARAGDAYLKEHGIDPTKYHRVARLSNNVDPLAVRYFLESLSLREADQTYRQATQMVVWEVRYFRPLEREEHHVYFDAMTGQFVDHRHLVDENAPGNALSLQDARALTERTLADHGYRLSEFELQDSREVKRKARTDYTFVWQAKPGDPRNVGEARYRAQVEIAGDEVVGVSDYFKLPEDWERRQRTTRLAHVILLAVPMLFGMLMAGKIVMLFIAQLRRVRFPWGASAGVGASAAILVALSVLNGIPTFEQGYSTAIPLGTYWLRTGLRLASAPILAGALAWVSAAFAFSLYPAARGVLQRSDREVWRRDAVVAVALCLAVAAAIRNLGALVGERFPAYAAPRIALAPSELATWSPALAHFSGAALAALFGAASVAVLLWIFWSSWNTRTWWSWAAMILLVVVLGPSHAGSFPEFLVGWMLSAISLAALGGILAAFFRNNALAYPAALFSVGVANGTVELLTQPAAFYVGNGIVLAALAGTVLGWMLFPGKHARKT